MDERSDKQIDEQIVGQTDWQTDIRIDECMNKPNGRISGKCELLERLLKLKTKM